MASAPSVLLVAFPFSLTFSPTLLCVEEIPVQLGANELLCTLPCPLLPGLCHSLATLEGRVVCRVHLWGGLCFLWRMAAISVVSRTPASCCREHGCYVPVLFNKRNLHRRIHRCWRTALFKAQSLDCFIVA